MAEIGSAFVTIAPSAKGFGSSLNSQVGSETRSAGATIGRTFGKMFVLGASLIAAAGVGRMLKGAVEEAREAQKVGAATEQIIKSTGKAANLSANQIGKLTSALSRKIGVDDEEIQKGANLLLTFKNVRNEVGKGSDIFTRATAAGADLAASGFGSIESNAKTLGKALNDPVKGMTALTRAGVTFTEAQKDQIKKMVESGDLLGAQKVLLAEVESQVGGVAAATATSGEKAKVAFGNLKESLGTALLPIIDRAADAFVRFAPTIEKAIAGIGPAFGRARAFLEPFINTALSFFRGEGGSSIRDFVTTLAGLFQTQVLPVLQRGADTFRNVVLPAVIAVAQYVATALFPIFQRIAGIVVTQVIPILASLATFLYGRVYPAIIQIVAAVASNLKPIFDQLVATMQARVLPTIEDLLTKFEQARPTIEKVVLVVLKVVGAVLKFAAAVLAKVLPVLIRFIGFVISKVVPGIANLIGVVAKIIGKVIDFGGALVDAVQMSVRFQRGVQEKVEKVLTFIGKIPGKIKGFFKSAGTLLKDIGEDIVDGLKRGIEGAWHKVTDIVDSLIKKIPKKIREIMGIASPSKVTTYLGEMIAEGLAKGVDKGGKKVEAATAKIVDKLKSQLETVRSDFGSLRDSVAGAFTGSLFDAETRGDFLANLLNTKGQLTGLKVAFKKLLGWGVRPEFLSQLFQSGNGGLILDLAAGTKGEAAQANALFGDITTLSSQLGTSVADVKFGDKLDAIEQAIQDLRKDQKGNADRTGDRVGSAINRAARGGRRSARLVAA